MSGLSLSDLRKLADDSNSEKSLLREIMKEIEPLLLAGNIKEARKLIKDNYSQFELDEKGKADVILEALDKILTNGPQTV